MRIQVILIIKILAEIDTKNVFLKKKLKNVDLRQIFHKIKLDNN